MDCEPIKNIAPLFNNYFYHGDNNQTYVLYNENIELKNICISDFHMHPCNNYETISDKNNIYKCNGHSTNNTDILVGYEFFKPKQIQICQWFIVSMPRQKVLLDCFLECMSNINILQTLTKNMPNYQKIVLKTSGPIMFTNKINNDRLSKITILPETYFCAGSGNYVPFTKNSYVRHHFVGSWR